LLVEARDLTRYYGTVPAVEHLDFSIGRGEIVGLLGPNGAGKSTTMRMLACFLQPTAGTARVAGHDVIESPAKVRRRIGYMPEHNALYGEMRVCEYLRFRAELKGVARRLRAGRIERCIETCGVADVRRQIIRTLSKGYRQRVGLADALLGEPEVLILDEPTIGLDPNQIRQTRETIRRLGEGHTILLSTHILQEVEAVCSRALIIDRGKIVADDSIENLSGSGPHGLVVAELKADAEALRAALLGIEAVQTVQVEPSDGWSRCTIAPSKGADVRETVFQLAARNGWPLRELTETRATLEDVFHRITSEERT